MINFTKNGLLGRFLFMVDHVIIVVAPVGFEPTQG